MTVVTHLDKRQQAPCDGDYLQRMHQKAAQDRLLGRTNYTNPLDETDAIIFDTGLKQVLVRRPSVGERCIVDWLNITIRVDDLMTIFGLTKTPSMTDQEDNVINFLSGQLFSITGFAIDNENVAGRNFYDRSFNLNNNTGFVAIGGQRNTLMISLNGQGCTYALLGWEKRLFEFLDKLQSATITRIDLAHDMLTPSVGIEAFDTIHSKGGFNKGGRNPDIEYRGNWKKPNQRGRTLYVGSRQSSRYCRIYEKGKALGDPNSPWLRVEVEFKSRDIVIPLDVLLNPTDYFVASYPCFDFIEQGRYERRFIVRDKAELISFGAAIELVKTQYGRYLHLFRECFNDDSALLDRLTDISDKSLPARLDYLTIPKQPI